MDDVYMGEKENGMSIVMEKLSHPYKLTHKRLQVKMEEAFCFVMGFLKRGEINFFRIS